MHPPSLDVGAILERFAQPLTSQQSRAVNDLSSCRTARLGGHIERCSHCGECQYHYRSCGNRHCPKCQAGCRAQWLDREASNLLPVEYHHLVFTLPAEVAGLAVDNPRLIYGLLLQASSRTVLEVAANPKHLGAQVGLTAVLHTWGQTLTLHPHVHIMASGGGLSCNPHGEIDAEPTWRSCRPGFFLPVRVLSEVFRGKFLDGLRQAHAQGELQLSGEWARLCDAHIWAEWLRGLYGHSWVVYSQPPSAGAEVVLKYLARYTYRVALSNSRLVAVSDEEVTFSYKDYRQKGKSREMTLSGREFARRFLQHVLPRGFVRVRHAGLLANHGREEKLQQCRRLLGEGQKQQKQQEKAQAAEGDEQTQSRRCPVCEQGEMRVVEVLPGKREQKRKEPDSS